MVTNLAQCDLKGLGIDLKALAVAHHLMLANQSAHQQSHAASTSALFNLEMLASSKSCDSQDVTKCVSEASCTTHTSQLAQDKISKFLDRTRRGSCKTLADGLKAVWHVLPPDVS